MPKKIEKKLSDAHRRFVYEYIANGYNATQAYKKVYPKTGYEAARSSASALLTIPNIREAIKKEFESKAMEKEEILARLADMGRATHYPFIEIDSDGFIYFDFSSPEARAHLHLIKKIKTKRNRQIVGKGEDAETWEGEWIEVELHDSKDALKLIGQHQKLFDPDKGEGEKFTAPQIIEIIKHYEKKEE